MPVTTVRDEREKLKRVSPFVLIPSLPTDWPKTKVEYTRADGSIGKHELPTHSAESVEHILYCLTEFNEAAGRFGWQGQERFQKYRDTLVGNARTKWDFAVQAGPQNHQQATFNQNIRYMITQMVGTQAYDNLLEYLKHAKKPTSMDPSTLIDRAQTLFRYAPYLSVDGNAGDAVPVAQQRRMILSMFPEPWVRNFKNSGQNPSTVNIADILQYMNEQYSSEVATGDNRKRNGNSSSTNTKRIRGGAGDQDQRRERRGGRGGGRGGRGGRGRGRNRNGDTWVKTLPPQDPDDPCRIHLSHKWRKCKFNPNRDADAPGTNGDSRNKNKKSSTSMYYIQGNSALPSGTYTYVGSDPPQSSGKETQCYYTNGGSSGKGDGMTVTASPAPQTTYTVRPNQS
jgi:hypothetical protein